MTVSNELSKQLLRWQETRKSLDDKRRIVNDARNAVEKAEQEIKQAEVLLGQLAGFRLDRIDGPTLRGVEIGDTVFLLQQRGETCLVTEIRVERCLDGAQDQGNESQGQGVPGGEAREAAPAKKAQSRQGAKAPAPAK